MNGRDLTVPAEPVTAITEPRIPKRNLLQRFNRGVRDWFGADSPILIHEYREKYLSRGAVTTLLLFPVVGWFFLFIVLVSENGSNMARLLHGPVKAASRFFFGED